MIINQLALQIVYEEKRSLPGQHCSVQPEKNWTSSASGSRLLFVFGRAVKPYLSHVVVDCVLIFQLLLLEL